MQVAAYLVSPYLQRCDAALELDAPTGAELVELGPVNATIHKIDECIAYADLDPLAEIYDRILSELLA